MDMRYSNPYADFGCTVTGQRFIGRENELRTIEGRVFGPRGFGSIAVVGLPRVGKTSLVSEAIRRAVSGARAKVVVVRVDVGLFDSADGLLRCLVEELAEGLRSAKLGSELIERRVNDVLNGVTIDFGAVRSVFKSLQQAEVRPVCVLDEFDAGRRVFRDTPRFFHWLRELCSNPEFKAAVLLIAKRRLQDISRLAGYESNYWANVLMTLPVKFFSEPEIAIFFSELEKEGILLGEAERREVLIMTGGHPYLLDAFGYHIWEHVDYGRKISVDRIRSICCNLARGYHEQVAEILGDGPMLSKLVQVLVGPQWDVTQEDVTALREVGALREEDGVLHGFSPAFEDHLRVVDLGIDTWSLWRDTERVLRDVLERNLEVKFGPEWPIALGKAQPKLGPMIEEFRKKRDREQQKFGFGNAESSLLSYSYPMELYQIMASDWTNLGEPLLGKNRQGWSMKFTILSKVRTPLAHNRTESVDEGERKQAEGICREILNRFREFEDGTDGLPK